MILTYAHNERTMLMQWRTRHLLLRRLDPWVKRVMGDVRERDEHAEPMNALDVWEICAGCACFKVRSEEWKEGYFEDVMDEDPIFGPWIGEARETLHGVVLDGLFCESCDRGWKRSLED